MLDQILHLLEVLKSRFGHCLIESLNQRDTVFVFIIYTQFASLFISANSGQILFMPS